MTQLQDMTFSIECDRCGQRLVLASGLNAYQMEQHPATAADVAARSGWALEFDGECECADCAVEAEQAGKAAEVDKDAQQGGGHA